MPVFDSERFMRFAKRMEPGKEALEAIAPVHS
jgi:hypothetical protein